jgi:acyl-coenzyme A thioesterase PaaI-like protein
MRAIASGAAPPPIAQLLGMGITEVSEGRAVFACEPEDWMYNPIGAA